MSKDKTPATTIVLKDEVIEIAAKIEASLDIDKKTGVVTEKSDPYLSNLPESVTPEIVETLNEYDTTFVAGGTLAFGRLAANAMKSTSSLTTATGEIKMGGKNVLTLNMERSKEFTNHLTGNGEKSVKYGVITAAYETRAGVNAGQLKKARALVSEIVTNAVK